MNSTRKAWIVATSIGVVEGLKDQLGVCRWNSTLRSIHQHAKANLRSHSNSQAMKVSTVLPNQLRDKRLKQSEESLRTVMYLSCWGPNN